MKRIAGIALVLLVAASAAAADTSAPVASAPAVEARGNADWLDFTLEDPHGNAVSLREFIGKKPVLLVFWATWCPHCNEAVPRINRLHADPATGGKVQILALDFLESREKVDSFIRRKEVAYPVLLDRKGEVARRYGVIGIPTYLLIDKGGRIVRREHELPDVARHLD